MTHVCNCSQVWLYFWYFVVFSEDIFLMLLCVKSTYLLFVLNLSRVCNSIFPIRLYGSYCLPAAGVLHCVSETFYNVQFCIPLDFTMYSLNL